MSADGSNVRRLTNSPGSDRDPAWSPDGRRIVFSSTRDDTGNLSEFANSALYVMNADGTAQTRITSYPGTDHQAAWSPDGSSIAFRRAACEFNCSPAIFKVTPDGNGLTQLTSDVNGRDRMPNWAPDGSKIVFAREVGSQHFFTMNPDGSSQTIIFGDHADPAWSPDGTRIAYAYPGIGHIAVDGSGARTVNTSGGEKPDWQPLVGPRRSDFKNGLSFCRAERDFLGEQEFNAVYGTVGGCVSAKS
jgi:Tol biopolymer transport system component